VGLAVTFYFWQIVPWPENTRESSAPRKAKQSGSSKGKSKKSGKEKKKKDAEGGDVDAVRVDLAKLVDSLTGAELQKETGPLYDRSRPVCAHS
jgi:hypothetical protein